jgi:hypothetical protein
MTTSAEAVHSATRPAAQPNRTWQTVAKGLTHKPVLLAFLVALVVRAALAVLIWAHYGGALFGDDLTYPQLARSKADGNSATWDPYTQSLYDSTRTLTVPLTGLYRLFGPVILVGQLWVALFGALTAAGAAKLAGLGWGRGASLTAGLAVALLPSQVLWSSLTLKDAVVWAALVGLGLALALTSRHDSWPRLLALAIAAAGLLVALAYLRQHTLVVAAWAVAIASWAGPSRGRWQRGVAGAVLCLVVPWATGAGPAGWQLITSHGSLEARRANNAANAATAFVQDSSGADPAKIAAQVEAQRAADDQKALAAQTAATAAATRQAADQARAQASAQQARAAAAAAAAATARTPKEAAVARARAAEAARAAGAANANAEAAEKAAKRAEAHALAAAKAADERARQLASAATKPGVGEAFGSSGSSSALEGNVRQLPKGLSVMVLEPYPWQTTGNSRVDLVRLEMLLWYPMLGLAAFGLTQVRRRMHIVAFPALAGGGILLTYALAEGNFGTAFRHRGELVWIVAVLAAAGAVSLCKQVRAR